MITELEWDSRLLGKKIGKLGTVPSENSLVRLLQQSREDGYEYITLRLKLDRMSEIRLLESRGFYITDVGSVWQREISDGNQAASRMPDFAVREATFDDASRLKKMVKGLFRGSRFYNDPFFQRLRPTGSIRRGLKVP